MASKAAAVVLAVTMLSLCACTAWAQAPRPEGGPPAPAPNLKPSPARTAEPVKPPTPGPAPRAEARRLAPEPESRVTMPPPLQAARRLPPEPESRASMLAPPPPQPRFVRTSPAGAPEPEGATRARPTAPPTALQNAAPASESTASARPTSTAVTAAPAAEGRAVACPAADTQLASRVSAIVDPVFAECYRLRSNESCDALAEDVVQNITAAIVVAWEDVVNRVKSSPAECRGAAAPGNVASTLAGALAQAFNASAKKGGCGPSGPEVKDSLNGALYRAFSQSACEAQLRQAGGQATTAAVCDPGTITKEVEPMVTKALGTALAEC